jgi:SH3 domain
MSQCSLSDSADHSDELSFSRGEILYVFGEGIDWWDARKADGSTGSKCIFFISLPFTDITFKLVVPSNFLTLWFEAKALYACV